MLTTRPRGTEDVLPEAAARWQALEATARAVCRLYGFGEIRTPTFEHSELFHRLGESTDVVQKETYDFVDRGGRRLTLRPEGTAAVVRALLENHLDKGPLPVKLYYLNYAAFRYERPEAGRLREHHQFGCEVFGAADAAADAELIALVATFLRRLGLEGWQVRVNSIGDPACRPRFREALLAYYRPLRQDLCDDCQRRLEQNPLRLLDCKRDVEAVRGAPSSLDYLCEGCADHFAALRRYLDDLGVPYQVDPRLVRGFDYYTRTVFEFVHGALGAQNSILGGGRYDGLVAALGGPSLPAVGFAVGMERLLLAAQAAGRPLPGPEPLDVFVAAAGEPARRGALLLCESLRRAGLAAGFDAVGRSLKAQLRQAAREARFAAILGEAEEARGMVALRDLVTGEQVEVPREGLAAAVRERVTGRGPVAPGPR
jgi:histidyl-tRNA synthetase